MAQAVVAGETTEGGSEKKVMVAIDESEYSYYALIWTLDNLKDSISKFPLIIFMAQQPTNYNYTFAAPFGSALVYSAVSRQDFVNSAQNNHRRLAMTLLEKAKNICASRGLKAEMVTEVGDPKTAICSAVQKLNVNLLILGQHGLGKIERALIGSVSNYCVQNVKCPVLVVKKP
ncbi:universal stress protein A-like protein [Melia azedarach]|uniref:Universal stress protein A-like protein n=1 Tax=Melia azedarach TaxID=155640 RepID=A0ACC1XEU0_MELAZ|nr:universal stress protein A-like protein [Melia azedarach]